MRTARPASLIRGLPARPRCSLALTEGQDYDPLDHFPGAAGPPVSGGLRPCFTLRSKLLRRQTQAFFAQLSFERLLQADQGWAILRIAIRRPRFPQGVARGDPERKRGTFSSA